MKQVYTVINGYTGQRLGTPYQFSDIACSLAYEMTNAHKCCGWWYLVEAHAPAPMWRPWSHFQRRRARGGGMRPALHASWFERWFGDTPEDQRKSLGLLGIVVLLSPLLLAVEVMLRLGPCPRRRRGRP